MGDLSMKMRTGDFYPDSSWKTDRIFTGMTPSYPVELFIALIEHEALQLSHPESKVCRDAWCLVSADSNHPAGIWKASVTDKYDVPGGSGDTNKWDEMKEDLLGAFGRHETPYGLEAKMQLVQSLTKADSETFKAYLFRVQWVLMRLGGNENFWTQVFFLLGLHEPDQKYVMDKMRGGPDEDVAAIVDALDDPGYVTKFKEEPYDFGMDDRDGGDDFGVDMLCDVEVKKEEQKPLKRKRKKVQQPVSCTVCGEEFKGKMWLANHVRMKHTKEAVCNGCGATVENSQEAWDAHETEAHLAACLICSAEVDRLEEMREHHRLKHGGNQMVCQTCGDEMGYRDWKHACDKKGSVKMSQSMKDRAGFRIHRIGDGEDPSKVRVMTSHLTTGSGCRAKWFCGFCRDEFATHRELTSHTVQAHAGFKYQCDVCFDYRAKDIGKVAQHKLQKHGVITDTYKQYDCTVPGCNFKTIKESNMGFHMRMLHSEETATETTCDVCGKRKGTPSALRRHVESAHMQLKPFSCDICKAGFAQKSGLAMHMKNLHPADNTTKVICNICGAELKHEASLKDHIMRKHNCEDPSANTCQECGKTFSVKYDLKDHMKRAHWLHTHLPCPKCDKRFPKRQSLRGHILSTHLKITIKPFACYTCGNAYVRQKDCWQHVALKHESWPNDRALKDWKILARTKPNLVDRRDCRKEEEEALKGVFNQDEFLKMEFADTFAVAAV